MTIPVSLSPADRAKRRGVQRLLIGIGALAAALAGCTTAPTGDAIPPFRQGLATTSQQTAATFADVNSFLRDQQIERAIGQDALSEDLFFEALSSSDLTKWSRAFALIDSYAEKLERLLDPAQRSGVEEELTSLGEKIEATTGDELPTGLSAGFTQLGGFLVRLKAERDALAAIRAADPAIQAIFSAMMEAIGADPGEGVRGTVWASWTQILGRIDVREFRAAADPGDKRAAAVRYVAVLDERDAQDQILSSLRLSIATLAKAHGELAAGRRVSSAALIRIVQDEHKAFREKVEALKKSREEASTASSA